MGVGPALLLLLSKGKFLLLGLTKIGTLLTMFASIGVYWALYGWALALGVVVSIYIHEMGHVGMIRRQCSFADRQSSHVQGLDQIEAACVGMELGELFQRARDLEVVRPAPGGGQGDRSQGAVGRQGRAPGGEAAQGGGAFDGDAGQGATEAALPVDEGLLGLDRDGVGDQPASSCGARRFQLHPDAPLPFAIGNCQAGYQTLMVAMLRPDLFGPCLVAGAPMSYWQGVHGKNPMRYSGGLLGGTLSLLLRGAWAGVFRDKDPAHLWSPTATGFVALIFVHEMGHLIAARYEGVNATVPFFIPFMGALISMQQRPGDSLAEAKIAAGGPILGSLGALACLGLYGWLHQPLFLALAYIGFFLNLFNLVPITPLDGGRILGAASKWALLAGLPILAVFALKSLNPFLFYFLILGALDVWGRFRRPDFGYYALAPATRWGIAGFYVVLAASVAAGPASAGWAVSWTGGSAAARHKGGLGLGLGGAKRLCNEFDIQSTPGDGTVVRITRWR